MNQVAPKINGEPVPDGYGVEIAPGEVPDLLLAWEGGIKIPQPYIAWLTKKNWKGEYERVREIEPGAIVEMEFIDQRVWYRDGVMRMTQLLQTPVEIAIFIANNA